MNERTRILLTVTLLGLSLLCALFFQVELSGPAGTHFVLLSLATLLFALVLFGMWMEEPWAYRLSVIFFSLALADLVWMYARTHDVLIGSVAIVLNAAGMIISLATQSLGASYSLETYDIEEDIRDLKKELEQMKQRARKKQR